MFKKQLSEGVILYMFNPDAGLHSEWHKNAYR